MLLSQVFLEKRNFSESYVQHSRGAQSRSGVSGMWLEDFLYRELPSLRLTMETDQISLLSVYEFLCIQVQI